MDAAIVSALTDSVRELERGSCAEVVLEIRSRSGSYAHADARFASVVAFLALIVLLFSPWHFAAGWVAIDVALAWVAGLFISRKSDSVRRLVTTRRERTAQARVAAAAAFHDRGVANTMRESGVLVFLSLLEEHVEVLADRGVLKAVPPLEWNDLLVRARTARAVPETLLDLVRAMAPLLAHCLPVQEGDVDELSDAPLFVDEE